MDWGKVPSEEELYAEIEPLLSGGEQLTDYEYSIMARVSTGLTVLDGMYGLSDLRDVYRVAGMYGMLIERTDDLIDGDNGFQEVHDAERLMENALNVIETGNMPDRYDRQEEPAYATAAEINELLRDDQAAAFRGDMQRLADTATEERGDTSHERHLDSAQFMFENAAALLDFTTEYSYDSTSTALWGKTGRVLQITDDLVDGDREISDEQLLLKRERLLDELEDEYDLITSSIIRLSEKAIRTVGKNEATQKI